MHVGREEMVQPAAKPARPVRELVGEGSLPRLEAVGNRAEGAIEPAAALTCQPHVEGGIASGDASAQSSIPDVGDEGTAISRDGIRPAR